MVTSIPRTITTQKTLMLVDLSTGQTHILSSRACEVLRSRKSLPYIDDVAENYGASINFEFDALPCRERSVLDYLREKKVATMQQIRCMNIDYVKQSVQLQPICESLKRKGYPVEVYRDRYPFLYTYGTPHDEAVRIAGSSIRLTDRQRRTITEFEVWVVKRSEFIKSTGYPTKNKPDETAVREHQINALRRAVPKLKEYDDDAISNAVDEPDGILGLFGLRRKVSE